MNTLSREQIAEIISYDPSSGHFFWRVDRTAGVRAGDRAGYLSSRGYIRLRILGRDVLSHRVAWLLVHGKWPKNEIDHINGVKNDNRLSNLRDADRIQNRANSKPCGTSGYKGVTLHRKTGKWQAVIGVNGKHLYLGLHKTPEAAHESYKKKAVEYYGEFARFV